MALKHFSIATATAMSVLPLSPGTAQAAACKSATSYIHLSNGRCYDLTYLEVASKSQQDLGQARNLYRQVLNSSAPRNISITETIAYDGSFSRRTFYYDTLEDRVAKQRLLQMASDNLKRQIAMADRVDRWAFRKHTHTLSTVSGVLASRSPEWAN